MKVLLINPNSFLINKSWAYKRFCTPIAPLGLCYIAAVLRKNGIDVSVIDQFASKISDDELIDSIAKEKPQIIGFSALTPVIPDVRRLVAGIRSLNIESKIVLGNLHGTCFPEQVIQEGLADIVVRGEGEITMLELCQRLNQKKSLEGLLGVSFKRGQRIVNNLDRGLIEDLDTLPYPAWDLLKLSVYSNHPMISVDNNPVFPLLASRGCNYRCYYCSQDKLYKKVRYRKLENLVDEIEYFHKRLNINFFGFADAYFPFNEESGLKFCNLLIKKKLDKKIKWLTETRVDKVTPRLLKAMKRVGLHLIMYGIEVGSDQTLKLLNKGTTLKQARIAVREAKKADILVQGLFMLGLPGETVQSCKDTINFAKELDCDLVKFNIATPYPGSRFFQDYMKTKQLQRPEILSSWIDWTDSSEDLAYVPEGMTGRQLRYLQRKAMFEFYVRPKIILRHIRKGTISYKNIFYGGLWLIFMLIRTILEKIKRILLIRRK